MQRNLGHLGSHLRHIQEVLKVDRVVAPLHHLQCDGGASQARSALLAAEQFTLGGKLHSKMAGEVSTGRVELGREHRIVVLFVRIEVADREREE